MNNAKHKPFEFEYIPQQAFKQIEIVEQFLNDEIIGKRVKLAKSTFVNLDAFLTGANRIDINRAGFRIDRKTDGIIKIYQTETQENALIFSL